jgi:hypothetical protein
MKQALHIFKKDVRYLRWELCTLLLFMGLFIYTQIHSMVINREVPMTLLLSCLWAFLCARLIQAETIPGDRQFWVTRPYQWRSLLGAKLLFVVVFISTPLLIADAVILGIEGFSLVRHIAGLMWSVLLTTTGTLLIYCAFATLMRGLLQWMLGAIVVVGVESLKAVGNATRWGGLEWIRDQGDIAILFMAALLVLLAQYKRRRMAVAVIVMAIGALVSWFCVPYLPFTMGLGLESRFSKARADSSSIQIAARKPAERAIPRPDQYRSPRQDVVALAIPVDVAGLGEGQDVISDEVRIAIGDERGEIWSREGQDYLQHEPNGYRVTTLVGRAVFERSKGRTVHLNLRFYLTLLGNPVSIVIRPGDAAAAVPGVGRCRYLAKDAFDPILCESPLRATSNFLQVKFGAERWGQFVGVASYSPFPADSSIDPLRAYYHSGSPDFAPATLTSLEPLAHFRRDIDITSAHLTDYQTLAPF